MRLIDADELYPDCMSKKGLAITQNQIANAPTIESEWIPVSERLPEEGKEVLVWFEYYRYGNYNCFYQTYGFCYVVDGKWSHFINGETGWRKARIIAWIPLPEEYKGVENE